MAPAQQQMNLGETIHVSGRTAAAVIIFLLGIAVNAGVEMTHISDQSEATRQMQAQLDELRRQTQTEIAQLQSSNEATQVQLATQTALLTDIKAQLAEMAHRGR